MADKRAKSMGNKANAKWALISCAGKKFAARRSERKMDAVMQKAKLEGILRMISRGPHDLRMSA